MEINKPEFHQKQLQIRLETQNTRIQMIRNLLWNHCTHWNKV